MKKKFKKENTTIAVIHLVKEEKYKTLPSRLKKIKNFSVVKGEVIINMLE